MRRCEFDFGRPSSEMPAGMPVRKLVADLYSDVMQHWPPPDGGYHGALNHVVIHGPDVTVPLGHLAGHQTTPSGSSSTTSPPGSAHQHFGTSIEGPSLQAVDLDRSYRSGPAPRGAADDLALVLCGRAVSAGRLTGKPRPVSAGDQPTRAGGQMPATIQPVIMTTDLSRLLASIRHYSSPPRRPARPTMAWPSALVFAAAIPNWALSPRLAHAR